MKRVILCLLCVMSVEDFDAQNRLSDLSYVFPQDSLSGFNEAGSNYAALKGGFFGTEYKVFMYRAKRNYVNAKYGYSPYLIAKNNYPVVNSAPCMNEDFEGSPTGSMTSVSGWTLSEGTNTTSCTMGGCCLAAATGTNCWIRTTPFICPMPISINIPNSPLGGNKIIQLNDEVINLGEAVRLEQTFPVTSSNTILQYAYMCMLNSSGHFCCDNPYFNVLIYDCSNNLIASASTSVVAPTPSCVSTTTGMTTTSSSGVCYFNSWQVKTVNLASYIGSCVRMEVTAADCDGWGHAGYAYFDAKCSAFALTVNGTSNSPSGNIDVCSGMTNTLSVPLTYTPVVWEGPPLSGISSNTNIVITTTASGVFTLTTGTGTNMSVNIFTLNPVAPPSVSLTIPNPVICVGGSNVILTGSPSGGVYSGPNVSGNIFVTPSSAGVYTVAYTYTNTTTTCTNSASKTITVNLCTGIQNLVSENETVKIYPNPNTGEFMIQTKAEDVITITNELGQVIKTIKLNSENNYLAAVSGLASGIYFATGKNFKEKIVVTK